MKFISNPEGNVSLLGKIYYLFSKKGACIYMSSENFGEIRDSLFEDSDSFTVCKFLSFNIY